MLTLRTNHIEISYDQPRDIVCMMKKYIIYILITFVKRYYHHSEKTS